MRTSPFLKRVIFGTGDRLFVESSLVVVSEAWSINGLIRDNDGERIFNGIRRLSSISFCCR